MTRSLEDHLFAPGVNVVLSLCKCGVREIISIAFLERVEALLKERLGRSHGYRLSDSFDLIGGTSTGSLLPSLLDVQSRLHRGDGPGRQRRVCTKLQPA